MVYSKGFSCERQKIGKGVLFYGARYGGIIIGTWLVLGETKLIMEDNDNQNLIILGGAKLFACCCGCGRHKRKEDVLLFDWCHEISCH